MNLHDLRPDSPFGVPLTPIPSGLSWGSVDDLLAEALGGLRDSAVRKHLLDVDPGFDAQTIISKPPSVLASYKIQYFEDLSSGFGGQSQIDRMYWPCFESGDIGMGVGINASRGIRAFCLKPHVMIRYVTDSKNKSQLNLGFAEESGIITCLYTRFLPCGTWVYAVLRFMDHVFLNAFTNGADLSIAQKGLMQSFVGTIRHEHKQQLTRPSALNSLAENYGSHIFSGTWTLHKNAKPFETVRVFAEGHWGCGLHANLQNEMLDWGIADRMQRMPVRPLAMPQVDSNVKHTAVSLPSRTELTNAEFFDSIISAGNGNPFETGKLIQSTTSLSPSSEGKIWSSPRGIVQDADVELLEKLLSDPLDSGQALRMSPVLDPRTEPQLSSRQLVPIAPAPSAVVQRPLTREERLERERQEKAERRKRQMREAAQRYNERKSRERREKRLREQNRASSV